jgi:hypothetical protein
MQIQHGFGIREVTLRHPKFLCEESLLRKTCAITFTLLIFTAMSRGQIPKSGNVFFGYSYSDGQVVNGRPLHVAMNGWEGTVEGKLFSWLGAVADFDWHYGGADTGCIGIGCTPAKFRLNGSRHSVLFGPRVSSNLGKYTPFAQALFGFSHQSDAGGGISTSRMGFSEAIGGGVDYKLVEVAAVRVQVDWLRTNLFQGSQDNLRMSTGIVFRF